MHYLDVAISHDEGLEVVDSLVRALHLSGRGYARVGRVARTIAALAESESVRAEHVAEALSYRSPDELSSV